MLHIGIVGMGGIGNNHARCYTANENAKVVAVCDMVKEQADKAAESYEAQAFYSVEEMIASGLQLDACSVTTAGGLAFRCWARSRFPMKFPRRGRWWPWPQKSSCPMGST